MLLNSGTPSLLSFTREMAGDPSTAAANLHTAQQVTDAINFAYDELLELQRKPHVGYSVKRAYFTTVADQLLYTTPADFINIRSLEISENGSDLSTASPDAAQINYLVAADEVPALQEYNLGSITAPTYVFFRDTVFGISAPPTSVEAGTNAGRITYEATGTDLSGDTDEPTISRHWHHLICYKAAQILRLKKNMGIEDLDRQIFLLEGRFTALHHEVNFAPDDQMFVTGLVDMDPPLKTGRYER